MTRTKRIVAMLAATLLIAPTLAAPAGAAQASRAGVQRASLGGAQGRILAATRQAFLTKSFTGFDQVEKEINSVRGGAQAAHYKNYWLGFLNYQKAIALMRAKRLDSAKVALGRSIATLKAMPAKDVEVNALLGLASGLNLAFIPRQQIVVAAQESGGYVSTALASGKPSARAFYASAIADWNTPAIYGGMRKAEGLARKAIALREPASQIRPTWGRDEAAALLIRIHVAKKRMPEARSLYEAARKQFPNSLALSEVASQI